MNVNKAKQCLGRAITWCHWLFHLESGEAVAIALDLETRKAIAIADAMRERLETLVIDGLGV